MRFTLITVLASLSAAAVHSSMIGSGSLVTRAAQKSTPDAVNDTSGSANSSSIETTTNSNSVNGDQGGSKKPKSDHKTLSGNSISNKLSTKATSGKNGTDSSPGPDVDLTESHNSTGKGTSNPLLAPLPKNATIEQKITRLEAKLADHKQKLKRAESELVTEKQKLMKFGGDGNLTTNASAPIESHSSTKTNSTGTGNSSTPI